MPSTTQLPWIIGDPSMFVDERADSEPGWIVPLYVDQGQRVIATVRGATRDEVMNNARLVAAAIPMRAALNLCEGYINTTPAKLYNRTAVLAQVRATLSPVNSL